MKEGLTRIQGRNKNLIDLYPEGGMNINSDNSYILVNLENVPIYTAPSSDSEFIIPDLSITSSTDITGSEDIVPPPISGSPVTINASYPQGISTQFFLATQFLPDEEDVSLASPNLPPEVFEESGTFSETTFQRPATGTGANRTDNDYPKRREEPRSITLHIVDGIGTAEGILTTVNSNPTVFGSYSGGLPAYAGIHYAIGKDGDLGIGISEDRETIHGNAWNTYGIGIEISGIFQWRLSGTQYLSVLNVGGGRQIVGTFKSPVATNPYRIVKFGDPGKNFLYWGAEYTQDYSDQQINTLRTLINQILTRYPKIKEGIKGKSVWTVFGFSGYPKIGKDNKGSVPPPGETFSSYGIFAHATGGGTHSDPQPTPKLIKLLLEFGYVA